MDIETMRREAESPQLAGKEHHESVAADLADAFTDDVAFDWFLRDDEKRDSARLKFFRLIVHLASRQKATIERPASGGAAAIWVPYESLGPLPILDELRAFPVLLHATSLARFERLLAMRTDLDKHHPLERRHAYLWFLGVTHVAQGHGVGSRLLKVATDRLDAQRLAAYLETQTERNIALYHRHGFDVISEHRPRRDGPMMWSMWREPKPEPGAESGA